jgi:hypothetical protein
MSEADRLAISSSLPAATTPTAETWLENMTANAACVGVLGVTHTTRLPLAKPSESTLARASSAPSSSLWRYRYVMMSLWLSMLLIWPCAKNATRCTTLCWPPAAPPLRGVSVRSSAPPVDRKPARRDRKRGRERRRALPHPRACDALRAFRDGLQQRHARVQLRQQLPVVARNVHELARAELRSDHVQLRSPLGHI